MLTTLWRSLVQPHLDYCGQLWHPVAKKEEVKVQEQILRAFTRKINGCFVLSYWDRLNQLKMSSCQRISEHYKVMYIWKVAQESVPNFGLEFRDESRSGRTVKIDSYVGTNTKVKSIKEASFKIEGAQIFNAMSKDIRDFKGSQ